ncbi:MAG: glycine cleavage system aminomethyltransferase GcvT [Candidatus Omnitrophica bacterium]|nr:glycine cleavage system aminomethyltransferase GcvT [Candidatus Omnitrophota bacterium]
MDFKNTPLLTSHQQLGASLAPFGGWFMPIYYKGIIEEHHWSRSHCSIFDICHMGEFIIQGGYKETGLDKIVTMNLKEMPVSSCRYGFMLNDQGGIIDDLIVYRIEQEEWMLVVNASTTDKDEEHIRKNLSWPAHFKNLSSQISKLDLQGPESYRVLKSFTGDRIKSLCYYTFSEFPIDGQEYLISRTGYTGELGYEIYATVGHVQRLWDIFIKDALVRPAGLGARDTLRLEMGYPLYGHELNDDISPYQAGLMRFVDLNKDFIGKDALLKQKKNFSGKKLVGLLSANRRSPREGYKIYLKGEQIGYISSGSFSPSLNCGIALGYVDCRFRSPGTAVEIINDKIKIEAKIVEAPFYKKGTVKK